jgi:hypothetical protein
METQTRDNLTNNLLIAAVCRESNSFFLSRLSHPGTDKNSSEHISHQSPERYW